MPRLPHEKAKQLKPVVEKLLFEAFTEKGGPFQIGPDTWPMGMPDKPYDVTGKCFVNGPKSLREVWETSFKKFAELDCLVYEDETLTFEQTWEKATAIGLELVHRYGIEKGDRVAIAMRNFPEWCLAYFAITAIGGVAVAINSMSSKEKELAYAINDSGCKVIFLDGKRLKYVDNAVSQELIEGDAPVCIACRLNYDNLSRKDISLNFVDFNSLETNKREGDLPNRECGYNDFATMMYTSGTTGEPKGVVLTNRGMVNQILMYQSVEAAKAKLRAKLGLPGLPYQDCGIHSVPLFHITGLNHILISAIANGKKNILMVKWNAGKSLQLIHTHKPTAWSGVPTMVQDMMEHPDFDKYDLSSLALLGGGGSPTPCPQVKKVYDKTPADAFQGYGLTETNGAVALIKGADYMERPASTGKAFPMMDVIIVDPETGKKLGPNETGEIVMKGALVMSHYWQKPEKTAAALIEIPGHGPGWFRSGDIGKIDDEGYIFITDRYKDLIIRGGENISCAEVESAVFEATGDEIMECAAFAVKDERLGEVVGLMVLNKPNSTFDCGEKIVKALDGKLAKFKIPKPEHVFFTETPLPRGGTGKILKRVIRDQINAREA